MLALLKAHHLGGFRRHWKAPGTPDFAWPALRIALFVDGCFWHGCPYCKYPPRTRRAFWLAKFESNRRHDRRVARELRRRGWAVLRVRECRIGSPAILGRLQRAFAARIG